MIGRRRHRGLALLDIQLGLALSMAVLLTAIGGALAAVNNGSASAQAQAWILQTVARTQASYASRADFSLLNQSSAVHDGLFPESATATGQPINPWGGDFAISGCGCAGAPKEIVVSMDRVPASSCVQLVSAMRTSGGRAKVDGHALNDGGRPTDMDELTTVCGAAGSDGARVQFFFDKQQG
jgi:hypothetical protein